MERKLQSHFCNVIKKTRNEKMNETPTSENGIWFLVKEIGALLFSCRVGSESLQMQLGAPQHMHL